MHWIIVALVIIGTIIRMATSSNPKEAMWGTKKDNIGYLSIFGAVLVCGVISFSLLDIDTAGIVFIISVPVFTGIYFVMKYRRDTRGK